MQMKLGIDQTSFTAVGKIEIPEIFFNRMKSGVQDFDKLFGEGLLPGAAITLPPKQVAGRPHLHYSFLSTSHRLVMIHRMRPGRRIASSWPLLVSASMSKV